MFGTIDICVLHALMLHALTESARIGTSQMALACFNIGTANKKMMKVFLLSIPLDAI